MRQVTKWESDDGTLHDNPGDAEAGDRCYRRDRAADTLAEKIKPPYTNADEIARDLLEHSLLVVALGDLIRACELSRNGKGDIRARAKRIAEGLRRYGRAGDSVAVAELSELVALAEDVAAHFAPVWTPKRPAGAIEQLGAQAEAGHGREI